MPAFVEKYSDDQRAAMAIAYADRGIKPAGRVVELARAGELTLDGVRLEAFETNANTVRTEGSKLRNRRLGLASSELAKQPPRDAIEALRRRLVTVGDLLLADYEKQVAKNPSKASIQRYSQIIRAMREAAAIPEPGADRPAKPGARAGGARSESTTRTGLGADILADHERTANGSPEATRTGTPTNTQSTTEQSATHNTNNQGTDETTALPGSHLSGLDGAQRDVVDGWSGEAG